MKRVLLCLLIAATLAGYALPAAARTLDDPIKVTLVRGAEPAPGEPPQDLLRIEAAAAATLIGLVLEGPGWRIDAPGLTRRLDLQAGEVIEIPFTATSANPSVPLQLRWTRDGRERRRIFDLSPESRHRNVPEPAIIYRTMEDAAAGLARDFPNAEIRDPLRELNATPLAGKAGPEPAPGAYSGIITVTGYVVCEHGRTGEPLPAAEVNVRATAMNLIDPTVQELVQADGNGFFYIEIQWNGMYLPDVFLNVIAHNSAALVEDATWEDDYNFGMVIYDPEPGYSYDVGVLSPSTSTGHAAFYIAETIRRGAAYLNFLGYPVSFLEVQWPDSDGSFYRPYFEEIHIAPGDGFNEGTILHEYGHHWNHQYARYPDHDYCNGECDDEVEWWFDDCGHCMWCEESGKVAWKEGIAQIVSRVCTDAIQNMYTVPIPDSLWTKEIQTIAGSGDCVDTTPDPTKTEGYFAALMYDLVDSHDFGEDDPAFPGYRDVMGGQIDEVFSVLVSDPLVACDGRPTYPTDFVACYLARSTSGHEGIWETFMNNGFDCDLEPPGAATHLRGYPAPGSSFPDATIEIDWTRPTDDASGVAGYSITWSPGTAIPNTTQDYGNKTQITSPPLAPGTWYFNIRAVDRAGRWSDTYATIGPFTVEPVVPADLEAADRTGWDFPLVPRDRTGATGSLAEVTSVLEGYDDTYWNIHGANTGTQVNPSARVAVYVDDEILGDAYFGGIPGGTSRYLTDLGPVTVDGGRHIMGMFLDSDEVISEASETDNYWAGQWAWRPDILSDSQIYSFLAPPINLAGFGYFNFQQPYGPNCRGNRIAARAFPNGIWMYATSPYADYDLKLFNTYSTPEAAFLAPLAVSEQGYNKLEAVFVNGYVAGTNPLEVGVFNNFDDMWGTSSYKVRRVLPVALTAFGARQDTVDADRMLNLYLFGPLSGTDGYVTFTLDREGTAPLHMAFYPYDFTTAGLLDAEETRILAYSYPVSMTVQVPTGQNATLAVWQDPSPSIPEVPYTLTYEAALPDPAPLRSPTWASCVVPRPEDDMVWPYTTVPAPATLPSDPESTWFYLSEINAAPITCPAHDLRIYLDGEPFYWLVGPELAALTSRPSVGWTPLPVRGGRHSVVLVVDPDEEMIEESEDNNRCGDQWVWEPAPLGWNTSRFETAPPAATGGWEDLPGASGYLNCLGYVTPDLSVVGSRAVAAYLAPQTGEDYDLRIHPHVTGSQDGFKQFLANSNHPGGEAEFVVFSTASVPSPPQYDVGVVNLEGSHPFMLQLEYSDTRALSGDGSYGPLTMAANDMLDVHKITMPAGAWMFSLKPTRTNIVDLGFSLHRYDEMTDRSEALALANDMPATGTETFATGFSGATQTYVIVVWRAAFANRLTAVDYTLIVEADQTGIGDGTPPVVTRLLPASPNPFTSATSIAFETAADGEVALSVFDMQGRRVCVLHEGYLPAGRHEVRWDGRDAAGLPTASGIYFVRLQTAGEQAVMKVVRVE